MPKRFSTARGREFGDAVRAALNATGMTAREISEKIDWDPGKLSDLSNGKGGCSEVDLAILLGFCRTPPEERDHLLKIYRETDMKDWWQQHGDHQPILPRTWFEHLKKAKEFISWCPLVFPGLLQVPDYTRAVILASANAPRDEVEQRVAARQAMQEIFRQRIKSTFYIHEQVLVLPVGGSDVLKEQLHHALMMLVRPYIEVRIVPTDAGAHAGFGGAFDLMKFDRYEPTVFLDTESSTLIVERAAAVKAHSEVLASLEGVALDAEQSRERITKLAT
ncbi:helix-turn-helix domain-containing protein [Lentzea sp. NEAU-D13]|uniref:Helix-turn-helix domain-containing protein n=1 Tax=Lentzea alba TaxID=2714351 RepID=A0A7C9RMI3_9PSEU|nr:helix-turn-helix transcriptional regulator [Lentzea alba]NGY58188.1 helix-turn-helix domain-containing protein [Lentzea alba]